MIARSLVVLCGVAAMLWQFHGTAAAHCHKGITYTSGGVAGCGEIAAAASAVTLGLALAGVIAFAILWVAGANAATLGPRLGTMNSKGNNGKGKSNNGKPPDRYLPGSSSSGGSRKYGTTVNSLKGTARSYARGMRRRGFRADVPQVRYDKYGRADVTVAVYRNTKSGWVLHHIRHFLQK